MARYRKVSISMHADERYRSLSAPLPNAQTLWVALLTGPRTTSIPGVVIARPAALAADLRWDADAPADTRKVFRKVFGKDLREGFDDALAEIVAAGMARIDPHAGLVWLPRGPVHNKPESPNVIRSWGKVWPEVPECPLKLEIARELRVFVTTWEPGYRKAFREVFGKVFQKDLWEGFGEPSSNQEQEQEQEQKDLSIPTPVADSRASAPPEPDGPPPPSEPPPWLASGSTSPAHREHRRREPPSYPPRPGQTIPGSTPRDGACSRCRRRDGTLVAYDGPGDLLCPSCLGARRAEERPHTVEARTAADALAEYRARLGKAAKPPEDAK